MVIISRIEYGRVFTITVLQEIQNFCKETMCKDCVFHNDPECMLFDRPFRWNLEQINDNYLEEIRIEGEKNGTDSAAV